MADSKITALTANTTPALTDLAVMVDDPSGTPLTQKITIANVLSLLNPVGTIREFNVSTNPATLLGFGTWTAFGTGRVTVAIDAAQAEFDTNGETGGAKTKNLAHTHTATTGLPSNSTGSEGSGSNVLPNDSHTHSVTTSSGLSATQDVMNPYIVVYRWVRSA